MPTKSPLPPKEAALFRRVVRCYEMKQYKNGVKFANQILSKPKFSDHGETLAMKGLILMCTGRRDDALELVRRGLRNDLMSHVCWHVYGLVHRAMHKYDEAIKAYRNALKWEKDNVQILRDLSLLQVQMRDLDGYKDTRYQLLALRPSQRASWIGYAASLHLLGDYKTALRVLEEFKKTLDVKEMDFEFSELILYMASVLIESGQLKEGLDFLNKNESSICDIVSLMETKGDLLLKLTGKPLDAKRIYDALLERNPDNRLYADRLAQIVLGTSLLNSTSDSVKVNLNVLESFLNDLVIRYPKASGLQLFALNALPASSQLFCKLVSQLIHNGLDRGIPPLFLKVRPLYKDAEKRKVIGQIVLDFYEELQTSGHFTKEEKGEREPPSTLVWACYFLAQHYDFEGDTQRAIDVMNQAISMVPTLPDLLIGMARICKHAGNLQAATAWADEAQALDTADRYLNYKCARYLIRTGHLEEADILLAKFTKPSSQDITAAAALSDMQCMWFLLEMAAAYRSEGQIGEALKKCHEIERHFSQMYEDQFDFHTYCPRKMTLTSYIKLLRLTDMQHSHRFYVQATELCVGIYCDLADDPDFADRKTSMNDKHDETAAMNERERRKLKGKQRKAAAKQQAEASAKEQSKDQGDKDQNDSVGQISSSFASLGLDGNATLDVDHLAHPKNPLEIATNFARPVIEEAADRIESHLLAFEVYWRKNLVLRMVAACRRAARLASLDDGRVHLCLVRLLAWLEAKSSELPELVSRVVDKHLSELLGSTPKAEKYNAEWLARLGTAASLEQGVAHARALFHFEPNERGQAKALDAIVAHLDSIIQSGTKADLPTATNLYNAISSGRKSGAGWCLGITLVPLEKIESIRSRLNKLLPKATLFMSKEEVALAQTQYGPPEYKQNENAMSNGDINPGEQSAK